MKIMARLLWNDKRGTFVKKNPDRQGKQEKCKCGSGIKFRKCCGINGRV